MSGAAPPALFQVLQGCSGFERDAGAGANQDRGAGRRIAALTGLALLGRECSEARQGHAVAVSKGVGDGVKHGVDDPDGLGVPQIGAISHRSYQI